jgi:hypothetical protein
MASVLQSSSMGAPGGLPNFGSLPLNLSMLQQATNTVNTNMSSHGYNNDPAFGGSYETPSNSRTPSSGSNSKQSSSKMVDMDEEELVRMDWRNVPVQRRELGPWVQIEGGCSSHQLKGML